MLHQTPCLQSRPSSLHLHIDQDCLCDCRQVGTQPHTLIFPLPRSRGRPRKVMGEVHWRTRVPGNRQGSPQGVQGPVRAPSPRLLCSMLWLSAMLQVSMQSLPTFPTVVCKLVQQRLVTCDGFCDHHRARVPKHACTPFNAVMRC